MTTPLGERIAALIAAQGPITIAQFMTLALHDRMGGYYATQDPLGAGGDFITAPEVSQMFGELLGLWLAQCWHDQGRPERPLLVELGPGRGTLMRDALRAMKAMPEFRAQIEIELVELSPALRHVQEDMLQFIDRPIRWVENFAQATPDRPLFLIANEFFDALPVRQFVKTARGWCERMVTADAKGKLGFALDPSPRIVPNRAAAPLGGVYEVSAAGEALAETIAQRIADTGGAALIVDYGFREPGFSETLQAVVKHTFADVLGEPGTRDLSAHVDFAALAAAARRGGAAAHGPLTQTGLLWNLGIDPRARALARGDKEKAALLGKQVSRLIGDDQMGTLFKALAIVRQEAPIPPAFGETDHDEPES